MDFYQQMEWMKAFLSFEVYLIHVNDTVGEAILDFS